MRRRIDDVRRRRGGAGGGLEIVRDGVVSRDEAAVLLDHFVVGAACLEQLVVRALLELVAIAEDDDLVGVADGRETMGDETDEERDLSWAQRERESQTGEKAYITVIPRSACSRSIAFWSLCSV